MDLWDRSSWMNGNVDFLFGVDIKEYDMKSAGFNLCKQYGLLPEDKLDVLSKMQKEARVKQLGLYQREDKELTKKLQAAYVEARKWFIVENELSEESILTIKKDAIFVMNHPVSHTETGYIRFDIKNAYTSFLNLNHLEFYINTRTKVLDIKGLGQAKELQKIRDHHGSYMLDFIYHIVKMKERKTPYKTAVYYITNFIKKYKAKELDIGYYRELSKHDSYSMNISGIGTAYVDEMNDVADVNISYNYLKYITPLASLYV